MSATRYGIFLRPDPATCWAVTQITFALRQQYGIAAAQAFAPHATLVGNLQIAGSADDLVATLDPLFGAAEPVLVHNHGVNRAGNSIRYDIDRDASGSQPNKGLRAIAHSIREAVLPLHVSHDDYLAPNVQDYHFRAHLTLAGFDLDVDPTLTEEVHQYIQGLPIIAPTSFTANWYTVFEFQADWGGQWWRAMQSRHVRSWKVAK